MQIGSHSPRRRLLLATATVAWLAASAVSATDIQVFNAGLDNPAINALLKPAGGGDPFSGPDPLGGGDSFNIFGFLDTGASGVLLSKETASGLNVGMVPGVTFEDVGIG